MSTQYYELNTSRSFSSANHHTYVQGTVHSDRIMSEHDFIYILSGSWEIYQDDIPYVANTGDVLLLHAGKHHYGLTPCAAGTKTMYIHIENTAGDSADSESVFSSCETDTMVSLTPLVHCQNNPEVKSLFSDIIYTLATKPYGYKTRLNALFSLLLLEIHRCLNINSFSEPDESVKKIIRLFQSNPEKHYTVKQLAADLYISEKTLSRRFLKYYGKTVYAYQNDMKLESVHQFIKTNPTITLREAALNYGFCDEFHLSKAFKKKYGVSPKHLLKK